MSLIDRRLWHPLTGNYVPADPGVWLFARDDLISAIERYLYFYNNKRYQQRLRCMTPMEFHRAAA